MRAYRKRKKLFYFLLEGRNKTERIFFQHFASHDASFIPFFEAPDPPITDPHSLFEAAKKVIEKHQLEWSLQDRVFIVLDLDHRKDHLDFVKRHAQDNRLIVFVPSQPCIEMYFLLHFSKAVKNFDAKGDEVISELTRFVPDYQKSSDIYSRLESREKVAKKRLRELSRPSQIKGTLNVADLVDLLERR